MLLIEIENQLDVVYLNCIYLNCHNIQRFRVNGWKIQAMADGHTGFRPNKFKLKKKIKVTKDLHIGKGSTSTFLNQRKGQHSLQINY